MIQHLRPELVDESKRAHAGPWLPDDEGLFERAKVLFAQREEEAAFLARAEEESTHMGAPVSAS